ncbi:MAG: sigma-E processing peptidase SpoIIGA [Clostridia bacterium]|nr:sigma-E processing peptidase SpoIIGA [Clostridia bacterium]
MQVYVEYVIIDNFIFDYLLLLLTAYKKRNINKKGKIVIASFIGSVIAVIFPLIKIHEFLLFILKILTAFLLIFLAFGYKNFKCYFSFVTKFIILTFLFGGSIYAVMNLFGITYAFLYGTSNSLIPLGFFIVCGLGLYYFGKHIINKIFVKKVINSYLCKCLLFWRNKKIEINGYFDSGNHLYHKAKGVCFASSMLNNKLLNEGFFCEKPDGNIEIFTVTGNQKIKVYKFDKLEIYFNSNRNIIYSPYIAVGNQQVNFDGEYDLILSCDYMFNSEA